MSTSISETSPENRPLLLLVDGHSLAFRAYYAYAKSRDGGLRTSTNIPTSVSYGFVKSLLDTIQAERPSAVAIAFDTAAPTFRHEADEQYKAGRPETPEDFRVDIQNLHQLLDALNVTQVMAPGYEADDVLGTLAQQASAAGHRVKILSGDQDLFQLIDPAKGISVLHLGGATFQRGGSSRPQEFDPEAVKQKLGVLPSQVVDYKALCGDTSDNIPGVKGIGAKTAVKLLETYGSLDAIYASLDHIQGANQKKLREGQDSAQHSQFMARIILDVPLDVNLEDCCLKGFDSAQLEPILAKLEFRSFLSQYQQLWERLGGSPVQVQETKQGDRRDSLSNFSISNSPISNSPISNPSPSNSFSATESTDDTWFFSAEDTAQAQKESYYPITPQIINTPEKLHALVEHLKTCTDPQYPVAWDTETTGLEPRDATLVGIGCCWGPELSDLAYIPVGHQLGKNLDCAQVLAALRPILEDKIYPKALQNAKFDRLVLRSQGIELAGVCFDTMLASYVLNPEESHNLTDLGINYLNIKSQRYQDLVPKGQTIANVSIPAVAHYCGMDVYTTFHLVPAFRSKLEPIPALLHLLLTIEQPLEPVLAEMEYTGIRINQAYLETFSKQLETELAEIEHRAFAAAGDTFNMNSPKQLSILLFETLNLNPKKSRKTKSGNYSTDASVLERLRGDHPVIDAVLEHRTLAKLKSTYVDALPALVRSDTQRVHTDFNQTITATGRLSSSNPNLQNIPIRTAFSRQIRQAFIPQSGWLLVAADYSQIELRILAHLSQEAVLINAFKQGEDVHTLTAQLLLEKDTITSDERRLGKIINFGVIYGMGAQRFARETGVSSADAKTFIERFNNRYPAVFAYLQQMEQEAIARGYVETILGRRRYFNFNTPTLIKLRGHDPKTINPEKLRPSQYDAALLRAAANAPIQGSSADIIKIAMIQLHEVLKPYQARLLIQVHDELVLEMPPEEWPILEPLIKTTMESALPLSVPLLVEAHAGQNWMETK